MFKYIFIILLIFSLSHCSLNHPVSMWNIENKNNENKLSAINLDTDNSYEEFKKKIIKYGELSNFSKLD